MLLISGEGLKKEEFRKRLRRIFTALNRHAKPTTPVENIIMDEDDISAVHTRRLIGDLALFSQPDSDGKNLSVDLEKAQLSEKSPYLTTISTIYEINKIFLKEINCRVKVSDKIQCPWFHETEPKKHPDSPNNTFFNFAPHPAVVDAHYEEIKIIWEGMIESIEEWSTSDRSLMKIHLPPEARNNEKGQKANNVMDHLLFWPVGQKGLARFLAKRLQKNSEGKEITKKMVTDALKNLKHINFDLFAGPWFGYVIRQRPKFPNKLGMTKVIEPDLVWSIYGVTAAETNVADMLDFLHGEFGTDEKLIKLWRDEWENQLVLWRPTPELIEEKWNEALKVRKSIIKK